MRAAKFNVLTPRPLFPVPATSNYGTHYVFNATDDVTSIGYANYGGRFLTLRALDPYGNNIADSFNVRWRVTEQITGTVLHNWSIEPSVTLYDLGVDKSFRIEAQSVNSSFAPWQAVFNFRAGYYAQADSGPDNVFPYKGQRGASCFLACLRNLIYMLTYGQQAPTEDELIDILFNVFGKSKESWSNAEDENHGTPDTHVVLWGNHILGPYGLTVTRQSYVTKADMAQKLRDNKVLIVYTEVRDPNQDPNSLLIRYVTHAIVLYKGTNGTIYVFDPNYGPVPIGDPDQNPPNFTPRKDGQGNDIPADAADQAVWNIKMYSKQIINGEVLYDWSNLVWEVSTN